MTTSLLGHLCVCDYVYVCSGGKGGGAGLIAAPPVGEQETEGG